MKKFLYILAIICLAVSCEKEQDNTPKAKTYTLNKLQESSASINDDELYLLEFTLHGQGFYLTMSFKSTDTTIPEGNYQITSEIVDGGCKVGLNDGRADKEVTSGNVTDVKVAGGYSINVELLSKSINYIFNYDGPINFDTTIVPSENTIFITEGNVTRFDMNTWQEVIVSGVSKYTLIVMDASDNTLASIEFINSPGKTLADITGEYNIHSGATSTGTVVAGAVNWGTGSGSFYYDDSGNQQYITSGKIKLTCITDNDGIKYYSITGSGLNTLTSNGASGSGALKLKHMGETAFSGTVIRNITVTSSAMGRSMKYSVYLPGGYDTGESFPILYLLHGYGDENNAWIDKGMLVKTAYSHEKKGGKQMIVVCPDGLTDFYIGKFETYMYNELMPHIESTYKFNGKRAVAGLSMGGYGTLYYWSKYPEMYCYAYAMSPAVDVSGTSKILADKDKGLLPSLTIETGIQDGTTPLSGITDFHNYLVSEGIEHEFITRDGSHDWKFWQECLPKVLNRCAEAFED